MNKKILSEIFERLESGKISKSKAIGNKNIVPQIKIEAVTFSFFLLLIFSVRRPPIT